MTRDKIKAAIRQQIRGREGVGTVQRLALDHMQPPIAYGREERHQWLGDLAWDLACVVFVVEQDEQWQFRPDSALDEMILRLEITNKEAGCVYAVLMAVLDVNHRLPDRQTHLAFIAKLKAAMNESARQLAIAETATGAKQ